VEGVEHLGEERLGIVPLGGGLALVAEDELDFLHAEAVLVEEGTAGVAGQVPVEVFGDACGLGYEAQVLVAVCVVADGGESLDGGIACEDGEWCAVEECGEGNGEWSAGFLLSEGEGWLSIFALRVRRCMDIRKVGGGEMAEVRPA